MFGLFPRCPLATRDKVWVERRMLWLARRFGADRLRTAPVVLPTPAFFPDPYAADAPSARRLLDRVCGYMGVDPAAVEQAVAADDDMPGAVGLYQARQRSLVWVAESQLAAPDRLVATLAHEVAHELLLKGGHLSTETADHEPVTDLLPVALGLGVLMANPTVVSSSVTEGQFNYFRISKQGYLSSITLGYALALFASARGEAAPAWAAHLRHDAAATLRAGLRLVRRTGDTLFTSDALDSPPPAPDPAAAAARLAARSPTARLAALCELAEGGGPPAALVGAVAQCLDDRDAGVRLGAVEALAAAGPDAAGAVPRLAAAVEYGDPPARAAAAAALGAIAADPGTAISVLAAAVGDDDRAVANAAAGALRAFGPAAAAAEPKVLAAAAAAAAMSDWVRLEHAVAALAAVGPDPKRAVRRYFDGGDPEVARLVLAAVKEAAAG